MLRAYLNGKLIPQEKALISIDDHGFLYGDGVYETMRIYEGKAFQLKEHLTRLKHSADWIGLQLPTSLTTIGRAIESTARANGHKEGVVRLTVTRGSGPYGFDPRPCKNPTLAIVSMPFNPYPKEFHSKGVKVALVPIRRNNPVCLPPHVKSTSCMNGVLAKREAIRLGAFEGVLLTSDGYLAEGTVSNVFLVKNDVIKTPLLNGTLLAGVTRDYVLKLSRRLKLKTVETRLRLTDIERADEIFLTNTTMEVMPIREIIVSTGIESNGQPRLARVRRVRMDAPGPLTTWLMNSFRNARIPAL